MPWPVAIGRSASLEHIAGRLRRLRGEGSAPQVVVLQEAFTVEARAIGAAAAFRYIVNGPPAEVAGPAAMSPADRAFATGHRLAISSFARPTA